MTNAGVFSLLANDGKADRSITATQLLNQRIKDIMCARRAAGKTDVTPTLVDLEKTHILFMNAHFKPFAAIGLEYHKVRPQSGSPALGNTVQFSLPQFGDFFHDMVGRMVFSSCQANEITLPKQLTGTGTPTNPNQIPFSGDDWDGTTIAGAIAGVAAVHYDLVDAFGNPLTLNATTGADVTARNFVRYCEYPGERAYSHVKFDVNNNPLDEYNSTTVSMLRKFTIGADKITGYKRLVGQEVPLEGYSGPLRAAVRDNHGDSSLVGTSFNPAKAGTAGGASNLGGAIPTLPQVSVQTAPLAKDQLDVDFPDSVLFGPGGDRNASNSQGDAVHQTIIRERLSAVDGPQTPKYVQPSLEVWNKLRFWFCDDPRLSIASVSIPYGQRFITVDLAPQDQLVYETPSVFIRQTIVTDGTAAAQNVIEDGGAGHVRTVNYRPYNVLGGVSTITVSRVELYVNNIFVNPEIHDIYIRRIGFSLIRVYRQHRGRTNSDTSDEQLLSQLKWPIEYMFVGLRPTWNTSTSNANAWRDWHRFGKVVDLQHNAYEIAGVGGATYAPTDASIFGQIQPNTYVKELKTVDSLSLKAHGINIHEDFSEKFFNSYVPFHFGGPSVITPDDEGVMMVNFALFPRSYQPSSHLNVSRARELYASWSTRYVKSDTSAEFTAVAVAINFLLITDGSAVLRYST